MNIFYFIILYVFIILYATMYSIIFYFRNNDHNILLGLK